MGRREKSKTLTPYHYGDALDDPWRTKILLRAWALHRARQRGWAAAREGRQREAARQADGICEDIRRSPLGAPAEPLLGSRAAHQLLKKWVPREVAALVPLHSSQFYYSDCYHHSALAPGAWMLLLLRHGHVRVCSRSRLKSESFAAPFIRLPEATGDGTGA